MVDAYGGRAILEEEIVKANVEWALVNHFPLRENGQRHRKWIECACGVQLEGATYLEARGAWAAHMMEAAELVTKAEALAKSS